MGVFSDTLEPQGGGSRVVTYHYRFQTRTRHLQPIGYVWHGSKERKNRVSAQACRVTPVAVAEAKNSPVAMELSIKTT